ncbi:hypothetical protein BD769DRAFT_1556561 [Suillus cothurnatus]|nr:hypothetical protein BD769DRAFT_1556561 [Suillus cothurnatus]
MPNMTRKPREKPAPYKQRLSDWLVVGALAFSQSALSRALKRRPELEARINSNPNALSSKRPSVVTRPDVEQALFTWVKHMEIRS